MSGKVTLSELDGSFGYSLLDPVLDLLIANGNELATDYRWGSNPTGYFAILKNPIDFDLVESAFNLPSSVTMNRALGEIDYGLGTATIAAVFPGKTDK